MTQEVRILRRKQVEARTGLPCSTLYDQMSKGIFPKPIKLGPRLVGWIESEITQWLEDRVAESRSTG